LGGRKVDPTIMEFWRLVAAATRADDELLDTRLIEPFLLRVLKFIESRPSERSKFVGCFLDLATARKHSTPYLVPFCMRTLRYPEVLAAVEAALAAGVRRFHDPRKWPWLYDVQDAYRETWDDSALFPFYDGVKFDD